MEKKVTLSSEKIKREKKIRKFFKIFLLCLLLLLIIIYFLVGIIYNSGNFSITLDKNLYFERQLIIYDDPDYKVFRSELHAKGPDVFDNISYKWLPNDMTNPLGEHNGDNYLAYTFCIENRGEKIVDYWYEVLVDDVIKNVDEAVRIRIYKNEDFLTYAKKSALTGLPENGTKPFDSDEMVTFDHIRQSYI